MSGTDDAAVQIVFRADPMANRDKIIAALRKAGHLRTPKQLVLHPEQAKWIFDYIARSRPTSRNDANERDSILDMISRSYEFAAGENS